MSVGAPSLFVENQGDNPSFKRERSARPETSDSVAFINPSKSIDARESCDKVRTLSLSHQQNSSVNNPWVSPSSFPLSNPLLHQTPQSQLSQSSQSSQPQPQSQPVQFPLASISVAPLFFSHQSQSQAAFYGCLSQGPPSEMAPILDLGIRSTHESFTSPDIGSMSSGFPAMMLSSSHLPMGESERENESQNESQNQNENGTENDVIGVALIPSASADLAASVGTVSKPEQCITVRTEMPDNTPLHSSD